MLTRLAKSHSDLPVVRYEERPWGAAVHWMGWIPIWGFFFNSVIWLYFKNRSREIIFHVQQAVQLQIVALMPLIGWIIATIFIRLIGTLNEALGRWLQNVADVLLFAMLALIAVSAIYGGILVYIGKPFLYPIIGKKVLEASLRKMSEN